MRVWVEPQRAVVVVSRRPREPRTLGHLTPRSVADTCQDDGDLSAEGRRSHGDEAESEPLGEVLRDELPAHAGSGGIEWRRKGRQATLARRDSHDAAALARHADLTQPVPRQLVQTGGGLTSSAPSPCREPDPATCDEPRGKPCPERPWPTPRHPTTSTTTTAVEVVSRHRQLGHHLEG
jgi:hypothetical protein